jgi:HSP20 family protein
MPIRPPRSGFSVARRLSERARAATPAADPPIAAPGGFAGMVDALRGLVEQLSEAARAQNEAGSATDKPDNDAGEARTSMVFGYTLRMGNEGVFAEPFGHVPQPAPRGGKRPAATPQEAQAAPAARQPIVEMFEDGDIVVVVAELPGADPDGITCRVDGNQLSIEATGAQHYRKELTLPAPVQPEGFAQTVRNGILELRLSRLPPS